MAVTAPAFETIGAPAASARRRRYTEDQVPLGRMLLRMFAGLVVLVYAIVKSEDYGWGSAKTLALFAVAAVLLIAFVFIERSTKAPLIRLGIFRVRPAVAAFVGHGGRVNPKHEFRNPKQARMTKNRMTQTRGGSRVWIIPSFVLLICFGFRASDFGFIEPRCRPRSPAAPRRCPP